MRAVCYAGSVDGKRRRVRKQTTAHAVRVCIDHMGTYRSIYSSRILKASTLKDSSDINRDPYSATSSPAYQRDLILPTSTVTILSVVY